MRDPGNQTNPGDREGVITNIQRFCYQDGPGVRTVVFLKGCSLSCKWCANPENIDPAVTEHPGTVPIGRMNLCGQRVTVKEVFEDILSDHIFYENSNGGVTASGGEPLLQPGFVEALFGMAHTYGMSTAVETAGNVPWSAFEQVLPVTDIVLHDIKLPDEERHRAWTGAGNSRILENYRRAYEAFPDIRFIARTPVLAGINDSKEDILAILDLILPYRNVEQYELLPYHRLGIGKWQEIGRPYSLEGVSAPEEERLADLRRMIKEHFAARGTAQDTD